MRFLVNCRKKVTGFFGYIRFIFVYIQPKRTTGTDFMSDQGSNHVLYSHLSFYNRPLIILMTSGKMLNNYCSVRFGVAWRNIRKQMYVFVKISQLFVALLHVNSIIGHFIYTSIKVVYIFIRLFNFQTFRPKTLAMENN